MRLRLNVLIPLAVFAVPCVFAQTTGVIRGTVTDPSGAVIGGAKVTAILQGTNTNRTTTSDPRGEYVLPTLAVGKLPARQREALAWEPKVPIVYTNVVIRDWTSWKKLGNQLRICSRLLPRPRESRSDGEPRPVPLLSQTATAHRGRLRLH